MKVTMTQIDRERGVVDLETAAGPVQVVMPPAAVQDLHVGDKLRLCVADEAPSQALSQDDILT